MTRLARTPILALLSITALCCHAKDPASCFEAEVEAHVLEQFRIFRPESKKREYFGFIYRINGVIASATTAGMVCLKGGICEVNPRRAARKIPAGAKVLGEWHTHPQVTGSLRLSAADVRGAHANRGVRCYRAFFSTARGDIIEWDPNEVRVSEAMASSKRLGNSRVASRPLDRRNASSAKESQ